MLIYKNGDILQAKESIICHQVNVDGIMGGGLALQIAKAYPEVEEKYKKFCNSYNYDYQKLKGKHYNVRFKNNQYIANCFTQKSNFETDYNAFKKCISNLLAYANQYNKTIALPYKMGCGIAKGNWEEIETILRNLSGIYNKDIVIYKLEV